MNKTTPLTTTSRFSGTGGGAVPSFSPAIDIDVESLLKRLRKNWYWFVIAAAVGAVLAWTQLRYETPIYSAQTTILIEEQGGKTGGITTEAVTKEWGFTNKYHVEDEIYVLKSRQLMEEVVTQLGLDMTFTHQGTIRNTDLYRPQSFRVLPTDTLHLPVEEATTYGKVGVRLLDDYNYQMVLPGEQDTMVMSYGDPFMIGNRRYFLVAGTQVTASDREAMYEVATHDPELVANDYKGRLDVTSIGNAGMLKLTMTDASREKAQDILNKVVEVYSARIVERQSKTGEQTINFIEDRLQFVTRQLYEVEANVAGLKRSQGMSVDLGVRGTDYLAQLNAAELQLSELRIKRDLLRNLQQSIEANGRKHAAIPETSEVLPEVLTSLIRQYNVLVFDREQRLETVTTQHPSMATPEERLNNLRTNILQSLQVVLNETDERILRVNNRIKPLLAQMDHIPEKEREYLQIMRQQQVKQNLFLFLLHKREEAALSIAAQVANTRVIDRASSSRQPISPNKGMRYVFAIGLALLVPAGFIFGTEVTSVRVRTENEVKKRFSSPIIGRIVSSKPRPFYIFDKADRSGLAEMFRSLRANLGFLLPQDKSAVVMVTSGVGGEGKSFVSSHLASSLALIKKRVVLVDLDMRKPKLGQRILGDKFNQQDSGVSSYLYGKAEYENILRSTGQDNLTLIQSGPVPPNPSELLSDKRLIELLDRLRNDFDIIMLDLPPVGIVADALLLENYSDINLYVVRLGTTPRESLKATDEMLQQGHIQKMAVVLNGLDARDHYGYGHGYYGE